MKKQNSTVHPDDLGPRLRRLYDSSNGPARGTMPDDASGLKEGSVISRQVRRAALRREAFNQVTNVVPNAPRKAKRKAARAAAAAAMTAGIYPSFTADQPPPEAVTQHIGD